MRSTRLGLLRAEHKHYDETEPLLIEALQARFLKHDDTHPHTLESWNNLIDLYETYTSRKKLKSGEKNCSICLFRLFLLHTLLFSCYLYRIQYTCP